MNNKPSPIDMLGREAIVPLPAALEKIQAQLAEGKPVGEENIPLDQALGRTVSRPVIAREDLPPQPRSVMDGYAVKAADTFGATESMPVYLSISGEVLMGEVAAVGPKSQECYKIATGGFLPPGTDAVVMFEHTVVIDDGLIEVLKAVSPGRNIINAGDDLKTGSLVFDAGKTMRPQELGLLAGLGHTEITVYRKLRVGIFSTGDEIVHYQEDPSAGKVRDMNGMSISSMVTQDGAVSKYYGIVADSEEDFEAMLRKAIQENDMVIFSGSSSVGTRDLGEKTINRLADPGIVIHGVAIKPGKPVIVAFAGQKPVYGLPGHPVSAAVAFELFVRPAIRFLSGRPFSSLPEKRTLKAVMKRNINSAPGRTDFVRVQIKDSDNQDVSFEAYPVLGKSGALSTMVQADGYVVIEESCQGLYQDEIVQVFLFD